MVESYRATRTDHEWLAIGEYLEITTGTLGVGSGPWHGIDQEMWSVLAGKAEHGAEFRDATTKRHTHVESRLRSSRVLEEM